MKAEIPNRITVTIGGRISRGIKAAEVTDEGKLIFTLTDGSELDLGSVIGPQGAKGETGAQGEKGDTGAQGPKGDTGPAGASITKIEKKSQSGQTATYTITLSDGKTFDFDINTVKGDTGAQGPKGDTGDTGPQGPKGDTGETGSPGPQGAKGDTGPQGPKGDKGDPGAGFTIKGYYGSVSALQTSVTGPDAGDTYGVGAAEPYDIYIFDGVTRTWVNNGPLQGAKGADGATPTIGDNGNWFLGTADTGKPSRGETGPQGDKGDKGEPGTPGTDGKDGANGATPMIGTNGNWYLGETDTGKPSRGETGPQGPAGATPVKGTDYFTEADKNEIADAAAKKVDLSGKQDKIMINGILKGNGSGGVTVAVADEDYTKYGGICLNVQHVSEGVYSSSVTLGTLDLYALRLGADEESNYSIFARVHNADYEFTWYALSHYMGGVKAIFSRVDGRTCDNMILTADGWTRETHTVPEIPIAGATDEGKFLRVVDGAWAAVTIPNANGGNF